MRRSYSRFLNPLTSKILSKLSAISPVLTSDIEKYTTEWLGRSSLGRAVIRPESTEQISEILKICHNSEIGVTVISGNTGLAGGTLSSENELIISLEKLNEIIDIDEASSTVTVESGVVLATLQERLAGHSLTTPYDLGARGSCTIGGNLATHAGGHNFVKYGPLRGHVLGLEVVLADGTILDLMSKSWKDNTGLNLKQLFIGSEGSLGILTKARLHCPNLPIHKSVALMYSSTGSFPDFVLTSLATARLHIGDSLSGFEFVDSQGLSVMQNLPFETAKTGEGFAILVEASGTTPVEEKVTMFFEAVMTPNIDGVVANDLEGCRKLWHYRDSLPVILGSQGYNLKFDVSLPMNEYYHLVEAVRTRFGPRVQWVVGYGHVADGNLHLNVVVSEGCDKLKDEVASYVYLRVVQAGGSVSSEHGVGRDKLEAVRMSKSKSAIAWSQKIKRLFDPKGIMNPGRTVQ